MDARGGETECNCQKENSLLETEEYKNYMIILLIAIIIALFFIYRRCR